MSPVLQSPIVSTSFAAQLLEKKAVAAFVAFLLLTLGIGLYRLILHPLAKFPGPLEARLWGVWRDRQYWRGSWHDDIVNLHRAYGPIVRIAPNELSIVDGDATKQLYNHGTKAVKTPWYDVWNPPEGVNLFSENDKKNHSFMRKRVAAAYSMSALLRYEEYIQSSLDLFLKKMRHYAEQGSTIDMAKWTDSLTFDVVGTLAYGAPLGMLETGTDVMDTMRNIHTMFNICSNMGHYWGQAKIITHPLSTKIQRFLGIPDPFENFGQWTRARVAARRTSEKTDREDMLSHFVNMKDEEGRPADDAAVVVEALNIIGAGADTTSTAMRACLYYLCQTPAIYQQVQQEIDSYYEDKQLSRPITYQQTLELPLLCAVIREATRLHPSIVYQLLRKYPNELIVDGKTIPAGTVVGMSPIAANRNTAIWGPDANEFRPQRWLEDPDRVRYYNTHDMTFGGSGPRTCIGRNIALLELHKFLAQLLRHFDVEFVDAERPWKVKSQWFANQTDMFMRIRYRGGLTLPQA